MSRPEKRTSLLRCAAESLGGGLLVSAMAAGIFLVNCERTSPDPQKQDATETNAGSRISLSDQLPSR